MPRAPSCDDALLERKERERERERERVIRESTPLVLHSDTGLRSWRISVRRAC